jgi:hypothetical protein
MEMAACTRRFEDTKNKTYLETKQSILLFTSLRFFDGMSSTMEEDTNLHDAWLIDKPLNIVVVTHMQLDNLCTRKNGQFGL